MATAQIDKLNVLIVAQGDGRLNKTFLLSLDTRLSELMILWKQECNLTGFWVFESIKENISYFEDSITLRMVGESLPMMVCLRAELIDDLTPKPTSEIFAHMDESSHQLFVKPSEKMYAVLSRLPGTPGSFDYDGSPLNINNTVQEAGLQNQSVIYKSLCSIAVKLSSGVTMVVQMPSDHLVLHLKAEVSKYEKDDFSLRYQGKLLSFEESVNQFKHEVEVSTADFFVNFNNQQFSWRTKNEPIGFPEFIAQLSANGDFDAKLLETFEFVCTGCERRIRHSERYVQRLPVDCCHEKSLTLYAMAPSNTGEISSTMDPTKHFKSLQDHLAQRGLKNPRTEDSRRVFSSTKERFAEARLDYNGVVHCSQRSLQRISELEGNIKKLEDTVAAMKVANEKIRDENKRLREEKKKLKKESEMRIEVPQGATASGPSRIPVTPDEQLGVPLLVLYHPGHFSPASGPEVQRGKYSWTGGFPHIKCRVPAVRPGSRPFEELRAALQRLFPGREILSIHQDRGSVAGREAAEVTSLVDDEAKPHGERPFCDVTGAQVSREEAKVEWQDIRAGGRVVIIGGRRTVLVISRF